jgi:alkane 1-monooxygenase
MLTKVPGSAILVGMQRLKPLGYLVVFLIPALLPLSLWFFPDHLQVAAWMPIFVLFGLIPLADWFIGKDPQNPKDQAELLRLQNAKYYRVLTLLCLPVQMVLLFWSAEQWVLLPLDPFAKTGWVLSHGLISAIVSINTAHELIHQRSWIERFFGGILLSSVSYAGFKVQHIRGHHVHVSTPKDPSTAKKNESLYPFLLRSWLQVPAEAFRLESARLQKMGNSFWNWKNELIWWYLLSFTFFVVLGYLFGPQAALFFVLQSFIAASALEVINYIEHYGLERKKMSTGRFEPVNHLHSWNSNFLLSNLILFQLQRHSDHHDVASRRYQALIHHPDSPQLPLGYASMFLLALVPPLWKSVMHPRLAEFENQRRGNS